MDRSTIETEFLAEADAREAAFKRQLAGDFTPPTHAGDIDPIASDSDTTALSARDAYLAREAARSRQPAHGALRHAVADEENDDEDATNSASGSARDAALIRDAARSRQPAGGAR